MADCLRFGRWTFLSELPGVQTRTMPIAYHGLPLKHITGPETIGVALELASTVQWFEGGCNLNPPYDTIVFIFESCFSFTKLLDLELRDTAYYSATAILQVHFSALHKSEEHASKYPIPKVHRIDMGNIDGDFRVVLDILGSACREDLPPSLLSAIPRHSLWISEHLLRFVSNKCTDIAVRSSLIHGYGSGFYYQQWHKFPSRAVENFLLVWCVHLGSEVAERP